MNELNCTKISGTTLPAYDNFCFVTKVENRATTTLKELKTLVQALKPISTRSIYTYLPCYAKFCSFPFTDSSLRFVGLCYQRKRLEPCLNI